MTRILVALALVSSVAHADAPPSCDDTAPHKISFHIEWRDGHPTTVIDGQIVICQKLPRPSVLYILEPHRVSYVWEQLPALRVLPRILGDVHSPAF